jgi:hypothetical protein
MSERKSGRMIVYCISSDDLVESLAARDDWRDESTTLYSPPDRRGRAPHGEDHGPRPSFNLVALPNGV